ncbi:hypothetical protein IC229_10745 [Spirosoma sp. BT702]|uniref:Uncharacterized protein n=1 Tax=Spirosoma profusum TaxID=2771354 RepID=A0A927AN49_9BACT|nr:hypothetical protein [Spirosoma profusum]MBD2701114.1 hypothetical protein [Spirosoma profusum]
MKKQFSIKPVQVLKSVSKTVTKVESNNVLRFVLAASGCCADMGYTFTGQSKPVFSL